MAAKDQTRRRVSTVIAAVQRHNGPDDPRLPDLRRDLRAAELEDHIRRIVDQAPPLTTEQREHLRSLLTPSVDVTPPPPKSKPRKARKATASTTDSAS